MIDPGVLRNAFVAELHEISELMSMLGAGGQVSEYIEEENGDLYSTIRALQPNSILVFIQEIGIASYPGLWHVKLGAACRLENISPFSVFAAIVNGKAAPGGLALHYREINPAYHPMKLGPDAFARHSIAVNETSDFDFWQMNITFTSKGTE